MQTAVFWSLFLWLMPWAIVRIEDWIGIPRFEGRLVLAVVLFVLASVLALSSSMTMAVKGRGTPLPAACAQELVVAGPYRYVRNPMAMAGLAQAFAIGLSLGSGSVLAYVATGFFLWNYAVRPLEEADLAARFGEPFEAYRREVPCWVPRLSPYRPS